MFAERNRETICRLKRGRQARPVGVCRVHAGGVAGRWGRVQGGAGRWGRGWVGRPRLPADPKGHHYGKPAESKNFPKSPSQLRKGNKGLSGPAPHPPGALARGPRRKFRPWHGEAGRAGAASCFLTTRKPQAAWPGFKHRLRSVLAAGSRGGETIPIIRLSDPRPQRKDKNPKKRSSQSPQSDFSHIPEKECVGN